MQIDISSPAGNTASALRQAVIFLARAGAKAVYIAEMRTAVLKASTAAEARTIIEQRTGGAITFVNSTSRS